MISWEKLKGELLERYGGHEEGDVYEQLIKLRHRGTVEEYIRDFEYLVAQIPKLPVLKHKPIYGVLSPWIES